MVNRRLEEFVGRVLDNRYIIEGIIGRGNNGSVYRARDLRLDKLWAVKEVENMLESEITALKSVNNSAFPRVVDYIKIPPKEYIVMDYIDGISLLELCSNHNATIWQIIDWGIQLAQAFSYLHSVSPQMVYLDCKPENILIGMDGRIHIVDMGSVYVIGHTRSNRVTGTALYASPEHMKCENIDERCDIYCLGMTLLMLMYGMDKNRVKGIILEKNKKKRCKRKKNIHSILYKCIEKNPEERYQSMSQLLYELRELEATYKNRKRSNMSKWKNKYWNLDADIYRGSSSLLPLLSAIAFVLGAMFYAHPIVAKESNTMKVDEQKLAVDMKNSQITIKNKSGYNILYEGQRVYACGEDILIEIPIECIDKDSFPNKIIYSGK